MVRIPSLLVHEIGAVDRAKIEIGRGLFQQCHGHALIAHGWRADSPEPKFVETGREFGAEDEGERLGPGEAGVGGGFLNADRMVFEPSSEDAGRIGIVVWADGTAVEFKLVAPRFPRAQPALPFDTMRPV
jgi:hypothetical protein